MTLVFVAQILVLMFVLFVIDLLARITNGVDVGLKHCWQIPLTTGTVSNPSIRHPCALLRTVT